MNKLTLVKNRGEFVKIATELGVTPAELMTAATPILAGYVDQIGDDFTWEQAYEATWTALLGLFNYGITHVQVAAA